MGVFRRTAKGFGSLPVIARNGWQSWRSLPPADRVDWWALWARKRPDDHVRYQLAFLAAKAIYPRYLMSDFGTIWMDDEDFVARYRTSVGDSDTRSADRKYTLLQVLRSLDGVPGDVAECGVFEGASAFLLAGEIERSADDRMLYLFDSFEGLSEPGVRDGEYWSTGDLSAPEERVRSRLASFGNWVVLKGWIPHRFHEVSDRTFALVHLDLDLAEPTLAALEFFTPRLADGGVIVLDDFGFRWCPGVRGVAEEFAERTGARLLRLTTGQCLLLP